MSKQAGWKIINVQEGHLYLDMPSLKWSIFPQQCFLVTNKIQLPADIFLQFMKINTLLIQIIADVVLQFLTLSTFLIIY